MYNTIIIKKRGKNLNYKKILQPVLLCAGIAMIFWGAARGEAVVVLNKAIKLCLECVGIG